MKRRTTKPAQIERVATQMAAKRVSLGLDPIPAEDIEYEALRAQARAAADAKKRKRRVAATHGIRERIDPPEAHAEFNERVHIGSLRIDARVYWTLLAQGMAEAFVWEVFLSCEAEGGTYYVSEAEVGAEREREDAYLRLLNALGNLAHRNSLLR